MLNLIKKYRRNQLRKFARNFTSEIKDRFGKKTLYSTSEIEEVAMAIGVNSKEREWAYGMFGEEAACQGFLSRLGSSKTARELRFFLGAMMFGDGSSVEYDSMWNRFDDPENAVMGGSSNWEGKFLDGSPLDFDDAASGGSNTDSSD